MLKHGIQFYLEELFEHPVDLVTEDALRPELRTYIEHRMLFMSDQKDKLEWCFYLEYHVKSVP